MKALERVFQSLLWDSRLVVIIAVITSLITSLAMFYIATADAYFMVSHLGEYVSSDLTQAARSALRATTVAHVVGIIDGYLLATILLIFSLGLYELFVGKIEKAELAETSSSVLLIESLDDLKSRLAKVILMILIVKFFEHAIAMSFDTAIDLLYLAGGIALIGLALYLSHAAEHDDGKEKN